MRIREVGRGEGDGAGGDYRPRAWALLAWRWVGACGQAAKVSVWRKEGERREGLTGGAFSNILVNGAMP